VGRSLGPLGSGFFVQSFAPNKHYYLANIGVGKPSRDDIVVKRTGGTILLSTSPAQFEFSDRGFQDRIWLDQNGNGIHEPDDS
jgi:hypothetical protein